MKKIKKESLIALIAGGIVGYIYYLFAYSNAKSNSFMSEPVVPILFFSLVCYVLVNEFFRKKDQTNK